MGIIPSRDVLVTILTSRQGITTKGNQKWLPFFIYMTYYVYILKSLKSGLYYKGMTHDVNNRLKEHNSGEMNFTCAHIPWELIGVIEKSSKSEAIILERKLKNLSRDRLEVFIVKYCE